MRLSLFSKLYKTIIFFVSKAIKLNNFNIYIYIYWYMEAAVYYLNKSH